MLAPRRNRLTADRRPPNHASNIGPPGQLVLAGHAPAPHAAKRTGQRRPWIPPPRRPASCALRRDSRSRTRPTQHHHASGLLPGLGSLRQAPRTTPRSSVQGCAPAAPELLRQVGRDRTTSHPWRSQRSSHLSRTDVRISDPTPPDGIGSPPPHLWGRARRPRSHASPAGLRVTRPTGSSAPNPGSTS